MGEIVYEKIVCRISKMNFCGSLFSRILQLVDTLRKWPDGSYSIPMAIYGCPDQAINNWKHGSINFTFTYPMTLTEASYGKISETNRVSHMSGGYFLNCIVFLRLVAFLPLVDMCLTIDGLALL